MSKPCSRCGKCCTNPHFQGGLSATVEDYERWVTEGRLDILSWCDPDIHDLWVRSDGHEASRCPFVRKDRGKPTYTCTIHETRPQVCRDYVPFSGKWNDICVDVSSNAPTKRHKAGHGVR